MRPTGFEGDPPLSKDELIQNAADTMLDSAAEDRRTAMTLHSEMCTDPECGELMIEAIRAVSRGGEHAEKVAAELMWRAMQRAARLLAEADQ